MRYGTMMVNMVCDMLSSIGYAPHTLYFVLLALIRWKLIQHGFVDGHSRFVVGIRVHNNNRAETVLLLFHDCRARHGTPSRVRGDHGTENIRVAEWMEHHRGAGRGSYIWGRYEVPASLPNPHLSAC